MIFTLPGSGRKGLNLLIPDDMLFLFFIQDVKP